MGDGGEESCFLCGGWNNRGAGSQVGATRPDRNGSDFSADGARDKPGQNQVDGVYPWIHLRGGEGDGLQETGDGIRGNLQKTEEGKVELRHMQRDGGGVLY